MRPSDDLPARPESTTDRVERHLREAILSGELRPRERVIEDDVAAELQCSRGPVREALLRLDRDGLIVTTARRGCFVRDISAEDVETIFRMRAKLEALCVSYGRQTPGGALREELAQCLRAMEAAAKKKNDAAFLEADMALHRTIWRLSNREPLHRTLNLVMSPFIFMAARAYSRQMTIEERLRHHREYVELVLETPMQQLERKVEAWFLKDFQDLDLTNKMYIPKGDGRSRSRA